MDAISAHIGGPVHLRAGDMVRIRSEAEVLMTLDAGGRLDGLPFMPEMRRWCGQTHRVYRRADKTCDSVWVQGLRRMERAVFLDGLRCDGGAHGGCQAACLCFWKEEWLQRVPPGASVNTGDGATDRAHADAPDHGRAGIRARCSPEALVRATVDSTTSPVRYRCQATELRAATVPLPSWDLRQYVTDVTSGNVTAGHEARVIAQRLAERIGGRVRRLVVRGNKVARPPRPAALPVAALGLQPGDQVVVRSRVEIEATLDARQRNRGLLFGEEMVRYCGHEFRVLGRVDRIIHEQTGQMLDLTDCVVLEGVICVGDFHRFCPRAVYPYWREAWLRKLV